MNKSRLYAVLPTYGKDSSLKYHTLYGATRCLKGTNNQLIPAISDLIISSLFAIRGLWFLWFHVSGVTAQHHSKGMWRHSWEMFVFLLSPAPSRVHRQVANPGPHATVLSRNDGFSAHGMQCYTLLGISESFVVDNGMKVEGWVFGLLWVLPHCRAFSGKGCRNYCSVGCRFQSKPPGKRSPIKHYI